MRVYIETNFVLELALEQDGAAACRDLLTAAQNRTIDLLVPAFSLVEAYFTIEAHGRRRKRLVTEVGEDARELSRSKGAEEIGKQLMEMMRAFGNHESYEVFGLQKAFEDIASTAKVLPLNPAAVTRDETMHKFGLEIPDIFVLAAVLADLREASPSQAVFVTRNRKGFDDPDIRQELKQLNCRVIHTFEDCVQFVRAKA